MLCYKGTQVTEGTRIMGTLKGAISEIKWCRKWNKLFSLTSVEFFTNMMTTFHCNERLPFCKTDGAIEIMRANRSSCLKHWLLPFIFSKRLTYRLDTRVKVMLVTLLAYHKFLKLNRLYMDEACLVLSVNEN